MVVENGKAHSCDARRCGKEHDCFELFTLGQSANIGFKSLKEFLSSVRVAGEILVHAYTGMRLHEVHVLPYDFFGRLEIHGMNSIPVVKSFTSKIDAKNYSEGTVWVSSNRLEIVAKVLQKLPGYFIYLTQQLRSILADYQFILARYGGSC